MSKKKNKNSLSELWETVGRTGYEAYVDKNTIDVLFGDRKSGENSLNTERMNVFEELQIEGKIPEIVEETKATDDVKMTFIPPDKSMMEEKEKKKKKTLKESDKGLGFVPLAESVIAENHIICHKTLLYFYDGRSYTKLNDKLIKKMVLDKMTSRQKNDFLLMKKIESISEYIQNSYSIDLQLHSIEPDEDIVTVLNGNFNLRTGKLLPHTSSEITLYTVQAKYLGNWAYLETPEWDQYILSAIDGDEEEVLEFVYAVLGYLICPSIKGKKFFVFGTAPDSGKSIFGNFLDKILKAENISNLPLDEFGDRFALSNLVGKVLNVNMMLPAQPISQKSVGRVKMLTGRDTVTVEKKYEPLFEHANETKLLFGTNFPIRLANWDEAFFDRMIVVPFTHSVPVEERDPDKLEKILLETDAIVTKALLAARKLYLTNFTFPVIEASERLAREWSLSSDHSVTMFIEACCMGTDNDEAFVSSEECYWAYQKFCIENKLKVIEQARLSKELGKKFPKARISITNELGRTQPRGFKNLSLLM